MKDYNEMAESVLNRRDKYIIQKRKQMKKITTTISCFCLFALFGMGAWKGGMFSNPSPANRDTIGNIDSIETKNGDKFQTSSEAVMPGVTTLPAQDSAGTVQKEQLQHAGNFLEENSTSKPFASAATDLTQEALYKAIGAFLPSEAPDGFSFDSATFSEYGYSVFWSKGMEELIWRIRNYEEDDAQCITSVTETKNYDLSLYPIPRADSVPDELRQIVDNPIFHAEDLTQAAVDARAYKANESGDSKEYRMNFSVLYGDKVISVTSKGVSPEWLYSQLSELSKTTDAPVQNEASDTGALNPLDDVWGGSYMDANGNWVVLLTEDTSENRTEVFERNPTMRESSTKFQKADYSLAYLTQLMADISRAMGDDTLQFVSTAALREDMNRVVVEMTSTSTDAAAKVLAFDSLGGAIEIIYGTQNVQIEVQKGPAQ